MAVTRRQLGIFGMAGMFLALVVLGAMWLTQSIPESVQKPTVPPVARVGSPASDIPGDMELPWMRDIADPKPVAVSLATCLWNGRDVVSSPALLNSSLATTPWDAPAVSPRRKR
jgi:hypothetical protein